VFSSFVQWADGKNIMKKIYWSLLLFLFLLPDDVLAQQCGFTISLNNSKSGSWESNCTSENNPGAYAKYYTFTLSSSQRVTIDLTSSTDTYLFLLNGSGRNGSVRDEDDDSGNGMDSRIIRTLSAGTYTVEATTYHAGRTGNFVVSVSDSTTPQDDCVTSINLNISKSGSWESRCASENRPGSYAKYYTFTLSSSQQVTIDLTSSKDTYLFLLNGSGTKGTVKNSNDDIDATTTNSQIIRTLSAGTYTVEATTYHPERTGNFVVSVSDSTRCSNDCPFVINAGLNDAWYNSATNGQGFVITVYPDKKEMFVAWFTYDTERPAEDVIALLGEPGHRWLTAQGSYDGDTANLTILVTEGGVFDSAEPIATTDLDGDGTLTIEFADCTEGLVNYEITSLDISGEIPIQRISPDNVQLCELLLE
jgi:hypothetical protein